MLELDGPAFMRAVMQIQVVETALLNSTNEGEWKSAIVDEDRSAVLNHLASLESAMTTLQATLSIMAINRVQASVDQGALTWEALGSRLTDIKARLVDELSLVRLFVLDPRMSNYLLQGEELVGAEVNTHFPSAIFDLEEAAKCLAVLRPTASAFHSMRALEVAIRAVARFLSIPDPTKPAERNWNAVLKKIKDGVELKYPTSAERAPHSEGARLEGIYANLDAVRNPWRNATMHAESMYQPHEADHILKCVHMLFMKLALLCDERGQRIS